MSDVTLRMLPPAGRLARLRRAGADGASVRLIERHARVYRHAWLVFFSGIFEPLFYLLSVGLGLGVLIGKVPGPGGQPVPYREFVAPGLMAVSSMNGAMYDSTFNVFFRLKYAKLYDAILATPIRPTQIALGEIGWALIRGSIYAVAFTLVMLALGLVHSAWAVLVSLSAVSCARARTRAALMACSSSSAWTNFCIHSHWRWSPSVKGVLGLAPKTLSSLAVSALVENTSPFWRSRKVLGQVLPLISSSRVTASRRVQGDPPPTLTTWPTAASDVTEAAMTSTTSST